MPGPLPDPTEVDRPYWEGARAGVLRLQRCAACRQLLFPPARRCPQCDGDALRWEDLRGRGRIWSWVVFRRQYFPAMPPPYIVVRVRLDEGPLVIANLVGGEPAIDAPVRAVFHDTGRGLVLPQFVVEG
ncbi:MAG: hypothetical protein KatS3mg060_2506 [Dehalococcoidia bacterium]|jgi:uncharacterized OB-fold protein|nr:MAG: hypothetical protein KatS3mg060_2506 [Dehalococcoidia bacterium]